MKIKINDKVKITAGKDNGKEGKIVQVFPRADKAVVEGLNLRTKFLKKQKSNESGRKIEFSAPLHISNLMLICPKCSKPTRVGAKLIQKTDGAKKKTVKVRICRKCKEII